MHGLNHKECQKGWMKGLMKVFSDGLDMENVKIGKRVYVGECVGS